jgi:hypothetical protein
LASFAIFAVVAIRLFPLLAQGSRLRASAS